ncbi:Glutamyl-tRNA(Gln) amidotransferase subunit F [Yarrowia sp. B02]|nr:Glutamyl-tRNA(Gln) amidotransferase subunit F [Yarrowia sp. B02]
MFRIARASQNAVKRATSRSIHFASDGFIKMKDQKHILKVMNSPENQWSTDELLAHSDHSSDEITSETLQKVSKKLAPIFKSAALPMPESDDVMFSLIKTLRTQVNLVSHIHDIDVSGVAPLTCLTPIKDFTYEQLTAEDSGEPGPELLWDALSCAEKKDGRFFVVSRDVKQEEPTQ